MLKDFLVASGLTEEDIAPNRAGKLSETQKKKLFGATVVTAWIVFFFAILLLFFGLHTPNVLCLVVFGFAMIERSFRLINLLVDLISRKVNSLTGPIELTPRSRSKAELRVGRRKFEITAKQLL